MRITASRDEQGELNWLLYGLIPRLVSLSALYHCTLPDQHTTAVLKVHYETHELDPRQRPRPVPRVNLLIPVFDKDELWTNMRLDG